MRYFFCIILPPLAVLSTGKINAFMLNLILCLFYWIPGIIHALLITNQIQREKRNRDHLRFINTGIRK